MSAFSSRRAMLSLVNGRRSIFQKYDHNRIPPMQPIKKNMEWLWHRPDPVPLPKTLSQPLLPISTCTGGDVDKYKTEFHEFVKPIPFHEYLSKQSAALGIKMDNVSDQVLDKVLPPRVEGPDGRYARRSLTADEEDRIRALYRQPRDVQKHEKWGLRALASEFKCSRQQVANLVIDTSTKKKRKRVRPKGVCKWKFTPWYPSAQHAYTSTSTT